MDQNYGRVVIVISIKIGRLLLRFYLIVPALDVIIIIIIAVIILSEDVVLIGLVIVWIGIREFMLHSVKDFQSNGGSMQENPDYLANISGER